MKECFVVCTYKREELLYCCLRRLRGQDADIRIIVFSDRGENSPRLQRVCDEFEADKIVHPKHSHYGNSFAAGEALRFAHNSGYDLIHYVEDDTLAKPDFLQWTRQVHENWDDIFCSGGWVFNRYMPIEEGTYFAPWIYIPQFSIRHEKLELVMPHLNPVYYGDLQRYIRENFKDNPVDTLHPEAINHFEIDGLLQRVLMQHNLQVAWNSVAKVKHCGFGGYNQGWNTYDNFFEGCETFESRVERVEAFAADPYWRMQPFDRVIVEREEGHELALRQFRYQMQIGEEWKSEFTTELLPHQLRSLSVINSVPVTPETKFVLVS